MAPSQLGIFTTLRRASTSAPTSSSMSSRCRSTSSAIRCTAFPAITVSACNLRPTSRGTVRLRSADPADSAGDRAELSVDRRGPRGRRRRDPRHAPADEAAGARALSARGISCPARRSATTMPRWPRPPATSAPRSSIPSAPRRWALPVDPMAVVDERLRFIGLERPARDRRLRDADHHLGQYQHADHHDRGKGGGDDFGG